MPNLNKDRRKQITTATTKRNDDPKKEGRIRESKLFSSSWMLCDYGEKKITHPVLLNNVYVHTHKEKKESLICHDFMRVIVLTVHKSKQEYWRLLLAILKRKQAYTHIIFR